MRSSYKINEKTCNFHFENGEIFHETSDLLSLLNVSPTVYGNLAKKIVTFVYMPDADPRTSYKAINYLQCIQESQLSLFLKSVLRSQQNQGVPTLEKLTSRILDKRLDSIVEMYTKGLSLRHNMEDKEIAATIEVMYRFTYESMELYARRGTLGESGKLAWLKTKTIFPPKFKHITEQRLFALLTLTAPIWPSNAQPVFKRSLSLKAHHRLCCVMNSFNVPGVRQQLKTDALSSAISSLTSELPKLKGAADQTSTP